MTNEKIKGLLLKAVNFYKTGNLDELEKVLKKIILIDSNYQEAYFNLGRLSEKKKEYKQAITYYEKSLKINPNHLDSIINLTNCYEDQKQMNKAVKLIEKGCELHPDEYKVYFVLGRLCHKKRYDIDKAFNAYKKTLSINSNFTLAELGVGQIYKIKGKFDKAKKIFKKIIESNESHIIAFYEIIDLLENKEIKEYIKKLENFKQNKNLSDDNKIYFNISMANMYEKIEKYENAFHYYHLGNNLKNKFLKFSISTMEKKFEINKKIIQKFGINKNNIGYKSSKPVFIIGMPRSGTTLVEQIISSHSKVFGGGELSDFSSYFILNNITEKDFINAGKKYINEINKISKKDKYFSNKLPGNFTNIGLIMLSLPYAKIIHCQRNALDNCLSCYKTLFGKGNTFSYSLDNLGIFYQHYEKQMKFFKEIFSENILSIKYEDVINDVGKETKKILNFLDIDFEKNCLEFYKNKRSVDTASLAQVRKPIYKNSINLWSKYKSFLKPLTDKLRSD